MDGFGGSWGYASMIRQSRSGSSGGGSNATFAGEWDTFVNLPADSIFFDQIAQAYVPEVRDGDKRIIVVEGEPVGAVLRRPLHWETRANFHVGGTAVKTALTPRDRIDVIGSYLTEVNVTSPTGIQEINRLDGAALERGVLDAVERRFRALGR